MRKRLFRNTLVIAAVVLGIFGLTAAIAADLWYTQLMISVLKQNTFLITDRISESADKPGLAQTSSDSLSSGGNAVRVTLVNTDGTVIGDSAADYQTMDLHNDRPEIVTALQNGWGAAQRYSETLRVRMLYVAVYDTPSGIIVRAAMPMYEIQKIYWVFASFVLASLIVSLAVAALMARRTARILSLPIVDLVRMTNDIAKGKYKLAPIRSGDAEFMELSNGLITLASSLDAHVSALESSNTQLTTVLASISEGLIAMDGEGRLLFVNNSARAMLALESPTELIGQRATDALQCKAVNDLAKECLSDCVTASAEITLPSANLLLQATASPMRPPAAGCILLLVDITQLRKLENMRRDFVANVTHELRTPLTSIRGYVETLQSGALSNPELTARFLQIIEIESERLASLISDLLYLSEIESSNQDTGIRPFRLADVARGVVELLEISASPRNISINCSIDRSIFLEANPDRIKQLLLNLADNAVKYNRVGGQVSISAEKTIGFVRISVQDTGIGISEEHVSRIFERFYRVDKGRSRSMGGTGLGLSIVKHIVDLYHGNIRLISHSGKGSEFIIELPLHYEAKKRS